ncbi:MAG: hypothetical protein IKZ41_03385 [Clostridia bacterium]|nr:hypothetical protein [Clostridia bacterium]MBR5365811.1 hypothetical protein [Clostridia bacterium]
MKQLLGILLALLLLASCAAGTAGNDGTEAQSGNPSSDPSGTGSDTPETQVHDRVPAMDFGQDMDLLMSNISWATTNIVGDEITGDLIGDAQYNMKLSMEERFNTTINEIYTDDIWSTAYVTRLITADDDTYEICFVLDLYAPGYANSGLVRSLEEVPYIDLTQLYWDQSLHPCVTIAGKTWFAFGCFDLSYYDLTHILTFNKSLNQDLNLDDPYTLVKEGRWTVDAFETAAKAAVRDVDGDGTMTEADSWGFTSVAKQILPCFWMSAGEQSIAKNEKDLPYLNIEGNERFFNIFGRMYAVMWDNEIWCPNTEDQNFWSGTVNMFGNNRALFAAQTFYYLNEFRDLDADFGILPYPKFTEDQDGYHSRVEGGCKIAVIPINNKNPEYAGALLEAMAAYSYREIIPEYYEVVLKRKNSRDEDSSAMLDLIFSTRSYDLGDTWWCNELRDGMFKPMFRDNVRDLASEIKKRSKVITKTIDRAISTFVG